MKCTPMDNQFLCAEIILLVLYFPVVCDMHDLAF
ncbi:hypothetical protein V6Z11_A12G281100 [Gossypium hirsutum]